MSSLPSIQGGPLPTYPRPGYPHRGRAPVLKVQNPGFHPTLTSKNPPPGPVASWKDSFQPVEDGEILEPTAPRGVTASPQAVRLAAPERTSRVEIELRLRGDSGFFAGSHLVTVLLASHPRNSLDLGCPARDLGVLGTPLFHPSTTVEVRLE